MAFFLTRWLQLPHTRAGKSLDMPETTVLHSEIIRQKRFLYEIYKEIYLFFKEASSPVKGQRIELGSGGGFIKEIIPNVITSDVMPLPNCDMVISAMDMPFSDSSVSNIYLYDVLHHLPNAERFFAEASRVLNEKGRIIMVEPANTIWGRFVYRHFHHEAFDPYQSDWRLPEGGPLSIANGALPWIIFFRDRNRFENLFPELQVVSIKYCYPFRYLISGGVSMKQLLPGFLYPVVKFKEDILLRPFNRFTGMFMKIILEKSTK